MAKLAANPREAVVFALQTLNDAKYAWTLAHALALDSDPTRSDVMQA